MFMTCIFFHLKRYVCSKHSLSFKTFVLFATHNLFHLKRLYCSRRTISFIQNVHNFHDTLVLHCTLHLAITITYCSYIYNEVLSCISKINMKKIETQFLLLRRNAKCYEEKSYHYQIYHYLKVKPSFHEISFQKAKSKLLLWIYAWQISGHLWFNVRQKLLVASLN